MKKLALKFNDRSSEEMFESNTRFCRTNQSTRPRGVFHAMRYDKDGSFLKEVIDVNSNVRDSNFTRNDGEMTEDIKEAMILAFLFPDEVTLPHGFSLVPVCC